MFFGRVKMTSSKDSRIPPNQHVTTKFPILHHGNVPYYADLAEWDLTVFGLVDNPQVFTYEQLMKLPQTKITTDIHCVTGWSRLDNMWTGISSLELLKRVKIKQDARYVIFHAEEGWTANLPLEDFLKETTLLAHSHNGEPLTPKHGFPIRAVVAHLYFWKSAKWLRKIEFTAKDQPGFWERNGYHNYGDPWKEQRLSWD
ncbi:sulfite oxidase-like oxidoreductase [Bacillus songklensis]|uniref:Sulfite oxidase-like oxidoreductase n=1 Tax=Bacillus songklensis TaxID=1069116 RepID=A0ABV8B8Q6_9BACI